MDELIETLSRVMATPMPLRQRLRIIGSAATELVEHRLPKKPPDEALSAKHVAAELRIAYLARNAYRYRTIMFVALLGLRRATGPELHRFLEDLVADVHRHGADGVEALMLAAADGVVTRADALRRRQARASVVSLAGHVRFKSQPPPNMPVPVGRVSSYLVLDVRADAVRELFIQLAVQSETMVDLPSLIDLLDAKGTRDALCDLPPLPNQTGQMSTVDSLRLQSCQGHGSGGSAQDGSAKGALGGLISSGCNLLTADEVDTFMLRLAKTEECMAERGEGRQDPDLALGLRAAWELARGALGRLLVTKEVKDVATKLAAEAIWEALKGAFSSDEGEKVEKHSQADKETNEALTASEDARKAMQEVEDLRSTLDSLDAEIKQVQRELDAARTDADRERLRSDLEELNRSRTETNAYLEAAKRRSDEKNEEADKEKAEADKAREEDKKEASSPDAELEPDDPFNSEACREAMGDPSDRVLAERLGADWTEWNETRGRLPHIWDPSPEDLQPYDSLRLPVCGGDDATVSNRAQGCDMPVECLEGTPDESCGCEGTPTDRALLMAKIANNVCAEARCDEGMQPTAQGLACVCAPSHDEEEPRRPLGPTPPVIAALFGNGTTPMRGTDSPTSRLVEALFSVPRPDRSL